MSSVCVVVNPISGAARGRGPLDTFLRVLDRAGVTARVRPTQGPGDAVRIAAEEAQAGTETVVAAGGDGTLNEVARGVLGCGQHACRVALLPHGTSNLVARHLAVPRDAEGAARVVLAGIMRDIDVFEANGKLSVACVGIGWDAAVVERLSAQRKGHIGYLSYIGPMWSAARSYTFPRLRVLVDDLEPYDADVVIVLNTRPYAAFFSPAPDASCGDGLLDVVALRGGRAQLPAWIFHAWRGSLPAHRSANVLRGRRVRVETEVPVPFQVDGDVGGQTPVDMLVRPGALRVLCPPPG